MYDPTDEDLIEEYNLPNQSFSIIEPRVPAGRPRRTRRPRPLRELRFDTLPPWVERPNPNPAPPMTVHTPEQLPGFVESTSRSGGTLTSASVRMPTGEDVLNDWFRPTAPAGAVRCSAPRSSPAIVRPGLWYFSGVC